MARPLPFNPPGDWVEEAICVNVGSAVFFPPDDKPVARDFYRKAKEVCDKCPVIDRCLEYGINEQYGVWGGTTPVERALMRRQRGLR